MSTYDHYATPGAGPAPGTCPPPGATRFSWEYDDGRGRLLGLYERGKDKQWDAIRRIDWDQSFDPAAVLSVPPEVAGFLAGSPVFE